MNTRQLLLSLLKLSQCKCTAGTRKISSLAIAANRQCQYSLQRKMLYQSLTTWKGKPGVVTKMLRIMKAQHSSIQAAEMAWRSISPKSELEDNLL